MMVLGAIVVAGISAYAVSVLKANHVVSERTKRAEAAKAGTRLALANPRDLYEYCGPNFTGYSQRRNLPAASINGVNVTTQCRLVDVASAQSDDERRFGLVDTVPGQVIPEELVPANPPLSDPPAPATRYQLAEGASADAWLADSSEESLTGRIWRPRLPSYSIAPRSATGTTMPAGWPECRVFFPGTYTDPLLLDGPTFFASGVYYFTNEIRVVGGAEVVVGDGATEACVTSQDALYYADRVPGEHNVNGYGATWVFGDRARLVISNDPAERDRAGDAVGTQPIEFAINRRYNQPIDYPFLPSSDVAIVTVDGDVVVDALGEPVLDSNGHAVGVTLDVPGKIHVREQLVGADDPSTEAVDEGALATSVGYRPSVYTPKARRPDAPTWPASGAVSNRRSGQVLVTWQAPAFDGGAAVSGYRVTATNGSSCETNGSLSCLVTGLPTSSAVTFTVVALNNSDPADPERDVESLPSLPSPSITASNTGSIPAAPAAPNPPTVTIGYDAAGIDADPPTSLIAHVTWTAPAANNAPMTGYAVQLEQIDPPDPAATLTCTLDATDSWIPEGETDWYPGADDLTCDIPVPVVVGPDGDKVMAQYRVTMNAANAIGTSAASTPFTVGGVPRNRVDMPVACDNPSSTTTDEYVAPDGTVSIAEFRAWILNEPLPTAGCAVPSFAPAGFAEHTLHEVPERPGQLPVPVIEIDLAPGITPAAASVNVSIPGYTSIAQGRLKVVNPEGHDVDISGGVMAAYFDIADARANGPGSVRIGYEAAAIQRKIELISTVDGTPTQAIAVVQINQNGAYAVNSWQVR